MTLCNWFSFSVTSLSVDCRSFFVTVFVGSCAAAVKATRVTVMAMIENEIEDDMLPCASELGMRTVENKKVFEHSNRGDVLSAVVYWITKILHRKQKNDAGEQ